MLIKMFIIIAIIVITTLGILLYYIDNSSNTNNTELNEEITLKEMYNIFNEVSVDLYNKKFISKHLSPTLSIYLKKNMESFDQILSIMDHSIVRNNSFATISFIVKLIHGEYGKITCTFNHQTKQIHDINNIFANKKTLKGDK